MASIHDPQNRTVLITGASRGLGAALARVVAQRGHRVLLVARNEADLRAVSAPLQQQWGAAQVQWLSCDLADPLAAAALIPRAEALVGPIHVLINNAGTGHYKPLGEWSPAEINDTLTVNLNSPILLTRGVLPGMQARGEGLIIMIASDLARRTLGNMGVYVASKFGLLGFAGSSQREARNQGIKVCTVMPGIIDSAFNGAAEGSKEAHWALQPAQLAAQIVSLFDLPKHLIIDEMVIHPQQQDY